MDAPPPVSPARVAPGAARAPVEARWSRSLQRWLRRVVPIRVRHARTLRDRALARRLRMAFSGVPLAAHLPDLRFFIYYHTVSLYATVPTQADANALVRLAETVPGVIRVVSHVRVAGGDGQMHSGARTR